MRDTFGSAVTLTLFGESHGPAIGVVLQGVAAGVAVDEAFLAAQMELRRAKGRISTARTEADAVRILSGVKNGFATGTAIALEIQNTNTRSGDYEKTQELLRPGHADYTAHAKYGGFQDACGGGHFSGRLTAPIVAAGSIFTKLLRGKGVLIATHLASCAGVHDADFAKDLQTLRGQLEALNGTPFSAPEVNALREADTASAANGLSDDLLGGAGTACVSPSAAATPALPVLDADVGEAMRHAIEAAAAEGDSVGGVLETCILGLPAGLGEPAFTSVESVLSPLLFSIPAVKGVEFGDGFAMAGHFGSEMNDAFRMEHGKVVTATNHNGGINGGITNGMPVVFRTAVKPTPSIYKQQDTVDWLAKENATLSIHGRHDPCVAHRARVVQDSMAALAVADLLSIAYGTAWQREDFSWNTD